MATDIKKKRDYLHVPLRNKRERKIIETVSGRMRRSMADTARQLFNREYERILKEEKEQAQLTTQTA